MLGAGSRAAIGGVLVREIDNRTRLHAPAAGTAAPTGGAAVAGTVAFAGSSGATAAVVPAEPAGSCKVRRCAELRRLEGHMSPGMLCHHASVSFCSLHCWAVTVS
jgi:hypothetical protein